MFIGIDLGHDILRDCDADERFAAGGRLPNSDGEMFDRPVLCTLNGSRRPWLGQSGAGCRSGTAAKTWRR